MVKSYEVKYKDGNKFKTASVKGYTLISALFKLSKYINVYEDVVSIKEISIERYHALNTDSTIRDADTLNECENKVR